MPVQALERKLTAIFAADVAGYSRLMGADEVGTLHRLTACRRIMDQLIREHRGRIFTTAGDSVVADFASAIGAVECAIAIQEALARENDNQPPAQQMRFRIGIHVGDVIVRDGNLFGDGVNIAARLESLAEPGGICVSGTVHDQIGTKLAVRLSELPKPKLKNIAHLVRAYRLETADVVPDPSLIGASLPVPDKPSIAVLPFQNMSRDPEQEYFADGMVEDIITGLSRIPWLFVLARNSSFTYKGQAIDVKRIGRELGVRYVLEGSVRKAGQRLRIAAQLIDAASGAHLWADRFDGALEDVFDLQDKVTSSVVGVIEPALQAAETARSASRPTTDLTAYDLYLRAYDILWSAARNVPEALQLMEQAIARDPRYGPALAWAAFCCYRLLLDDRSKDPRGDREKGIEFARRALEVARDDPAILTNAAIVLASLGEDLGAMMALVDRALTINPNYARGWHISGTLKLYAGQLDTAIEHLQASLRLSPRAPIGASLLILGSAYLATRQFDEAAHNLRLALEEDPSFTMTYRVLASCYAHMGRLDEAREMVTRLRTLTSVIIPDARFIRDPEQRELWLSGLRIAAGEEA
jgi:TolB-like protein/class 3 adenylate cyclase